MPKRTQKVASRTIHARLVDAAHVGVRDNIVAGRSTRYVDHPVAGDAHPADDPRAIEGPVAKV